MAKRPLNHFEPVLCLDAKKNEYNSWDNSWDITGTFCKRDMSYIPDNAFESYDPQTGFGPDAKLDLSGLQFSAYVRMSDDGTPEMHYFRCEYAQPYRVDLKRAERMVATLKHIETVRNAYESKGFYASDVESAMLQTLDAIGCSLVATPTAGFGNRAYGTRSDWETRTITTLPFILRKICKAYADAVTPVTA